MRRSRLRSPEQTLPEFDFNSQQIEAAAYVRWLRYGIPPEQHYPWYQPSDRTPAARLATAEKHGYRGTDV